MTLHQQHLHPQESTRLARIVHNIKDPEDRRALTANDTATQTINSALFKYMAEAGSSMWTDMVAAIVRGRSATPNR